MLPQAQMLADADKVLSVLEHTITWEDDIWKADPFDIAEVHSDARQKFITLLDALMVEKRTIPTRILLFHGQSGAGKTHLIRALRNHAHGLGRGYFGYAQMTPDVANYANYFLRRLISSLEKPYDPIEREESGLKRLSRLLAEDGDIVTPEQLDRLREAPMESGELAQMIIALADDVLASPRFAALDLDINIVRALLYMQRNDPRIDQRVRQYLYGSKLNDLSHAVVAALDPNDGEGRGFEIMESLGRIMQAVDGAALVFCIDQVEDLRFYEDAEDRFQRAIRDLIQIANRVPTAIIIISCLGDFYAQVREFLTQSFMDRIEQSGPVLLADTRTRDEAQQIVHTRLAHALQGETDEVERLLGANFYDELAGLSTRRVLEAAQSRWRELNGEPPKPAPIIARETTDARPAPAVVAAIQHAAPIDNNADVAELWERFISEFDADVPTEEQDLIDILSTALYLCRDEKPGLELTTSPVDWIEGLAGADINIRQPGVEEFTDRIFICNKSSQGGALKRQIEKVLSTGGTASPIIARTSEFPPNARNATSQALRNYLQRGGRRMVISLYEWERMMAAIAFHERYRRLDNFRDWLASAQIISLLPSIEHLIVPTNRPSPTAAEPVATPASSIGHDTTVAERSPNDHDPTRWSGDYLEYEPPGARQGGQPPYDNPHYSPTGANGALDHHAAPALNDEDDDVLDLASLATQPVPTQDNSPIIDQKIADQQIFDPDGLHIGHLLDQNSTPITLPDNILRRHAAMLGGSGSGKTTLAISIIEQLLLRGIPVVLIDRKGDLSSYANPDVWRSNEGEPAERRALREELGSAIDVAVYTPGRTSGRPIGITLLPNGIAELPEHEQQQLANVSAAALGDMLHLKNSATHQRQGGILAVALKLLGTRSVSEVTLTDLIFMLENDDAELVELTQRMDPSGKLRRDLIAQMDSLRHRNWALFEGGGEPLRMESLLGIGRYAKPGRTRLSIIYTGFLGANENILFWVSQFLSEALRFSQRNPAEDLQAVIMFDEADLYIPANSKPATSEPLQSLLKRARSAGIGIILATQSPGDLDYKSRDQITSWFIGRVREDTALRKLRAAFGAESGLDPARVLPNQTVGEFHLVQEAAVYPMRSKMSLINADQVPFDRIEQLARETRGQSAKQLRLEL